MKGIDGGYKLSKLTIRKNNHLSWENLPLFKNSLKLFKFESAIIYCHANSLISLIAQRERTCIFTDTLCVSLGALCELGRTVVGRQDRLRKYIYFSLNVIFFMPENKISNSVKVLLVVMLFHYIKAFFG